MIVFVKSMVFFLYGEDTFSSLEKLRQLKEKFKREVDTVGSSLADIEGKELDVAVLRQVVLAPALFARRRFVAIRNFLQTRPSKEVQEEMISLLKSQKEEAGDTIVVFWEGGIEPGAVAKIRSQPLFSYLIKQKHVEEFVPMDSRHLEQWIKKHVSEKDARITTGATRVLSALVGNDMWRMNNEIEKLAAYQGRKDIDEHAVKTLVDEGADENIYHFLDAVTRRDIVQAVKLLTRQLSAKEGGSELIYKLQWHIHVMVKIKACIDEGISSIDEIAKKSGLHRFVVQKNLPFIRKISREELEGICEKLIALETDMRRKAAPLPVLFTRFVIFVGRR